MTNWELITFYNFSVDKKREVLRAIAATTMAATTMAEREQAANYSFAVQSGGQFVKVYKDGKPLKIELAGVIHDSPSFGQYKGEETQTLKVRLHCFVDMDVIPAKAVHRIEDSMGELRNLQSDIVHAYSEQAEFESVLQVAPYQVLWCKSQNVGRCPCDTSYAYTASTL